MLKRKIGLKSRKGFKQRKFGNSESNKESLKKPSKNLKKVSTKRLKQNQEYTKLRKEFLSQHTRCAVYPNLQANQIHHSRGRIGRLLCDMRWWIPVSQEGHRWIEENHREARTRKWNGVSLMCRPEQQNVYEE